jgi:hypothetical protein
VSVKENMPPLPWGVGGRGGISADVIRGENAKRKMQKKRDEKGQVKGKGS